MIFTTYFEIGGHIVECESSILGRPLLSFAAASSLRSARGDPSGTASSPQAVRTAEGPYTPAYTVGVGQGNPLFWMGAAVLIRGVQALQNLGSPEMTAV